jgi:hypothetical protein
MSDHGLDILFRPEIPAVVARWQREITPLELQTGYLSILSAADACGCARWLLDLRRREELATPDVNRWVEEIFLPQLQGRYAQSVRLAFLISPLRARQLADAAGVEAPTKPAPHTHQQATFIDEAAAYAWLAG